MSDPDDRSDGMDSATLAVYADYREAYDSARMALAAVKNQRDMLAQAMWDVRKSFGFDTDGDDRYHTQDFGHIAESFRRDMAEVNEDLDDRYAEVVEENDRAEAAEAARASAWDEGYLRGTLDAMSDLEPADNPYAKDER